MKRFLLIFLLSFFCFFSIDKVYAENSTSLDSSVIIRPSSIKLNGTDWKINEFRNFSTGQTFNVKYDGLVYFNSVQPIWSDPFYIRYALCTDGGLSGGWSNLSNASDVRMYNTSIRCNFYGSNYDKGRISFWSFQLKPNDVVAGNGTARFSIKHDLSAAVLSNNSVGLMAIEYSLTPFPVYNESDTLIKQNDSILSSLDEIKTSLNNNSYNTNLTNEKLTESNKLAEETNKKLEETNQAIKDTNDTIKDSDTSEASGEADSFFSGFTTDTHGLTSIITAPLSLIGNITSSSCSPLQAPLPFVNKNISLPCMSTIYKNKFGSFFDIYQTITFGIVAYWVCVRIFNLVKDFKNPNHDEVEVMDL